MTLTLPARADGLAGVDLGGLITSFVFGLVIAPFIAAVAAEALGPTPVGLLTILRKSVLGSMVFLIVSALLIVGLMGCDLIDTSEQIEHAFLLVSLVGAYSSFKYLAKTN